MRLPRHSARDRHRRPSLQRRTRSSRPRVSDDARARRSRRSGLTARAAVLAVALCAVVLTLAVPMQQYVAQRHRIGALAAETKAQEARVARLEAQKQRWADPAYIEEQARERLHFVEPGETEYVVVPPKSATAGTTRRASTAVPAAASGPWYSQLWDSVVTAAAVSSSPAPKAHVRHRHAKPQPIQPGFNHPRG